MLNKVILIGRLGNNVEVQYTPSGTAVARFSLATDEPKKNSTEKHTEWHRIVVWGKLAETCEKYLKKGSLISVEGKLRTRSYEDREGNKRHVTEIHADSVRFLSPKKQDSQGNDDIPF